MTLAVENYGFNALMGNSEVCYRALVNGTVVA